MKYLFLVMFFFAAVAITAAAQQGEGQKKDAKPQIIKPTLVLGDIEFLLVTMNRVELKGSEVEAFLEVKTTFMNIFNEAQKAGKTATDNVKVELPIMIASNTVGIMNRAVITGVDAERYKRIIESLKDAAQDLQQTNELQR